MKLTEKQAEFLEKNILFKISADKHLTQHEHVAFTKYRDLITVVEEIFNDGNFKIEQSVSIDAQGIPRLVEFIGYVMDDGIVKHAVLVAQFVTYHETKELIFESDLIALYRIDKIFYDKPIESFYETIAKTGAKIGEVPLYAKCNPQPVS